MQIAMFVAVIGIVLFATELGEVRNSVSDSSVFAAVVFVASFGIAATATARLKLSAKYPRGWHRTMIIAWLLLLAVIHGVFTWAEQVRLFSPWISKWFLDELLLFAPLMISSAMLWSASFDLENSMEQYLEGVRPVRTLRQRWRFMMVRAKFFWGLFLLPALLMYWMRDVTTLLPSNWQPHRLETWCAVPTLLLLVLAFPFLLKQLWNLTPLEDSPLRNRLLAASAEARVSLRNILIWRTENQIMNAFVVGTTPWFRYVLLTDALMATLTDDEIVAVFRHELGHLRRKHLRLRLMLALAPLILWAAWEASSLRNTIDGSSRVAVGYWMGIVFGLPAVAFVLGWCSRLQEHDADFWACSGEAASAALPTPTPEAVQLLTVALEKLSPRNVRARKRRDWLHPSLEDRLSLLKQATTDPRQPRRIRRQLACLAACVASVYIASFVLLGS